MKLNLLTSNPTEECIKSYLENNVSEYLANKINNGVPTNKDGKELLNKKTLAGFMDYANNQARELAQKGKNYAMVAKEAVTVGLCITLKKIAS